MSWTVNLQETDRVILPAGKKLSVTLPVSSTGAARSGTTNTALTTGTTTFGAYTYQTEWYIDCLTGTVTYDIVDLTGDEILSNSGVASLAGMMDLRGNYDASGNTFPATGGRGASGAILKGDSWIISVGGTLNSIAVTAGDVVVALADTPGQTGTNWTVVEKNMGYTPENAANKDATGGYAGLTLFKINFKNAANTFTNFFTNATTAARTWTFPDKDGTALLDTDKDATGGVAGLTLFKINFKNAANTFTNFLTNATTAARTYTFQDKDGTIADLVDVATKLNHTGKVSGAAASAGEIGEIMTSTIAVGSAVSLTTATPANITSLALTAGAWEIRAVPDINLGAATITDSQNGISATSATFDAQDTYIKTPLALTTHTDAYGMLCPPRIVNIAAPATYYLVTSATFSAGTVGAFGTLEARRIAMA